MMPKQKIFLALIIFTLVALSGCTGSVTVSAVDATWKHVSRRHDAYVSADVALSVNQKAAMLSQSAAVNKSLTSAREAGHKTIKSSVIQSDAITVCDRHDAYIRKDIKLDVGERETYLTSSDLVRRVLLEAK